MNNNRWREDIPADPFDEEDEILNDLARNPSPSEHAVLLERLKAVAYRKQFVQAPETAPTPTTTTTQAISHCRGCLSLPCSCEGYTRR